MHFSSEGDRLITASFDNTARVNYNNNIKFRYGTPIVENALVFYKIMMQKSHLFSLNLQVNMLLLALLIEHAKFGMLEVVRLFIH